MKKTALFILMLFCFLGFSFGQSSEKTSIIITMAEQYDANGLEQRTQFMNRTARAEFVVNELKQFSQDSQADLLKALAAAKDEVSDITSFWIFNGISCKADQATIQAIKQRPDVRSVALDTKMPTTTVTYEPCEEDLRSIPWNILQIQADKVWDLGYTGKNIVIAILDSGINYYHVALQGHLWDGDGQFPHYGWNYVFNSNNPFDDPDYGTGQGTMVAGVIVGKESTNIETGIAPDAKVMALKTAYTASNTSEYLTSENLILQGIQFATEHSADIILVSACEKNIAGSQNYLDAMKNLRTIGKVAITAAGDQGQTSNAPLSIGSPASCPSPWHNPDETITGDPNNYTANICVGGTNKVDGKVFSSSIGPVSWIDYPYTPGSTTAVGLTKPDLSAPGTAIRTTVSTNAPTLPATTVTGTVTAKGSALAAAHVAATVALMLEANPNLTPELIDQYLETSAVKCEGLVKKNNYYGAGRLDALEAVNAVLSNVNAPTNLNASANANQVTLTWTAANNASSYNVYCNETCIAENVTGTNYLHNTTTGGHHLYYLKSNGSSAQSGKSNYAYVFVTPEGPLPTNLRDTDNNPSDNKVILAWDAPTTPTEMRYGQDESTSERVGFTGNPAVFWGQRFNSDTLIKYAGCTIDSLSFYFVANANYDIAIYNGDPNGTKEQLYHTTYTPTALDCWSTFALNTPVTIDHTQDLWIVAKAPANTPSPIAYCEINPNLSGYASMFKKGTDDWEYFNTSYAWMIKAKLSTGNYTYNVLRDGNVISTNPVNALTYTDNNVPAGSHEYTITTNYNNGNSVSFPSEAISVNIGTYFVVTFDAGSGTCPVATIAQEETDGAIVLPTATPTEACQGQGYTFVGWSTEEIEDASQMPELMLAGEEYTPTGNITLYAVYQIIDGYQGWILARSIHDGDLIRIVSEDLAWEYAGGNGTSTEFDETADAEYPFTVMETAQGYALQDATGNYLYLINGDVLGLSNNISDEACHWTIEMINGLAILRNKAYDNKQVMFDETNAHPFLGLDFNEPSSQAEHIRFYRYISSSTTTYDHSQNCTKLQKPKITPFDPDDANVVYLDPVRVTMSSNISGVTIKYSLTTDGLNLTYYSPVTIAQTTTVRAKATKAGYEDSDINTATYNFPTEYTSISAFKTAANGEVIANITSEMRAVYQYGRYLYVSDNTAGLLIYDDYNLLTDSFVDGDYIGNVQGRYTKVNEQVMLVLMHDIQKTGENSPVTPLTKTVKTVKNNYNTYDARLMLFKEVSIALSADTTVSQNGNQLYLHDQFAALNNNIDPSSTYDVIGVMGINGTRKMIYPRSDNDIRRYYNITCATTTHGTVSTATSAVSAHSTVDVTVTPESGYHVESLYYYTTNPNQHTDIDPTALSFEMPENDITIVATFAIDIKCTVTFNAGDGNCDTESITETSWQSGVILPVATPSENCAFAGFTFEGWADHFISETTLSPVIYTAGETYYPTADLTLYAVYSRELEESEWTDITSAENIIEGQYVIGTWNKNKYYFMYQNGATTNVGLVRMNVSNGMPTAYNNYDPKDYIWTISATDNPGEYSITYTGEDGTVYYLRSTGDQDEYLEVTSTAPEDGWVFTNDNSKGMLARFTNPTRTLRYLDLVSTTPKWTVHSLSLYIGQLHFFMNLTKRYATIPDCPMPVETPEFVNVPEGPITTEEYMVTITCATPDAIIYYTTDGTEPDNNATLYTGPFSITETTTVKAIGYNSLGGYSYVASQDFTFITNYATIAEFKAAYTASSNEIVKITGDVTAVYQHGNYLYLCDATAALLVKDNNGILTQTYNNGDLIQGGIVGRYQKTSSQAWMLPTTDFAEGVAGTPVEPEQVTAANLISNYEAYDAKLVMVTEARFTANYNLAPTNATATVKQGNNNLTIANQFGTLTMSGQADEWFDITGFVGRDNTTIRRLYPRTNADFNRYYTITCDDALEHGAITAPEHAHAYDMVTLDVTPEDGYELDMVTVSYEGYSSTYEEPTFEMPAHDISVTATFAVRTYEVNIVVEPEVGGTVELTPAGPYYLDDDVTATATPTEGYRFTGWYMNGVLMNSNPTYYITVTNDMTITAKFQALVEHTIYLIADPAEGGTVTGTGIYAAGTPVTVTATPNPNWAFVNWTEGGVEVSTESTITVVADTDHNLWAHFVQTEVTQTTSIGAGWSWFSSYIDAEDLLSQMEEDIALTSSTAMIKGQNNYTSYGDGMWAGQLNAVNNEEMVLVLSQGAELTLTGPLANPEEHPITLNAGWNWIGFISAEPMTTSEALANLTPGNNDMIKSQTAFASYNGTTGEWTGLYTLTPGEGYLYLHNGEPATLIYATGSKGIVEETPSERYWKGNHNSFPTNLTMMVSLDGNEFAMSEGSHEVGAFVNGECRGSARLQKIGDQYIALLTVTGDNGEEVSFQLYDVTTGTEYAQAAVERINFQSNDIYGSLANPMTLHFTNTGIGETSQQISLFPNPATDHVTVQCQEMRQINIWSLTGQVLLQKEVNADETQVQLSQMAKGLYLMEIIKKNGERVMKRFEID